MRPLFAILATFILVLGGELPTAAAQAGDPRASIEQPPIDPLHESPDAAITARLDGIFAQIPELSSIRARTVHGVVTLAGSAPTAAGADRAAEIARRIGGVVTVENEIERNVSIDERLSPVVSKFSEKAKSVARSAPLILLAASALIAIAFLGHLLAGFSVLWRRLSPNAFVADLLQSTIRLVFIGLGIIAFLTTLDAAAFLGAFLGAAGVLGLAVGFAVRDPIENYLVSVMLSLRQPFRPHDHVIIGECEGKVARLTSRATILLTLDGDHLRIPNSTVFKSVITNFTTNSERRMSFTLGVDADDDPIAASRAGVERLKSLAFILDDPPPVAHIREVGDSSVIIDFYSWIDQRHSDFHKSRSSAIAAAKLALEQGGFTLPEPIYRLRFDERSPRVDEAANSHASVKNSDATNSDPVEWVTAPQTEIDEKVRMERRGAAPGADLLDEAAPSE